METIKRHEGHPAINVKKRNLPYVDVCESARERAYDLVVHEFWCDASRVAHKCGYSGVFSAGRSGGWLVPFFQYRRPGGRTPKQVYFDWDTWDGQGPDKGNPIYPNTDDTGEAHTFARFQAEIEYLLEGVLESYRQECEVQGQVENNE